MMDSSLSLIRFNVLNFFYIVINSRPFYPTTTVLAKLVDSIISSETEPDAEMMKRVQWIRQFTHDSINMPLSVVELLVFKNLHGNLNREIEIGENNFYLIELYSILDEVVIELTRFVVEIGKRYSMEFPVIQSDAKSGGFSFGGSSQNDTISPIRTE